MVQHERVAGCEVFVSHLAKFGNGRVRCPGVAPCDLFLIIFGETEPDGKVNANIRVQGMGGGLRDDAPRLFAAILPFVKIHSCFGNYGIKHKPA